MTVKEKEAMDLKAGKLGRVWREEKEGEIYVIYVTILKS